MGESTRSYAALLSHLKIALNMARIDFYVLQDSTTEARIAFAAKLCQRAFTHTDSMLILLDDHGLATQLSQQLWAFRPESFLPHALAPTAEPAPPIIISSQKENSDDADWVLNLRSEPLSLTQSTQSTQRVAEIVIQDKNILEETRNHYRHYQQSSHEQHNGHEINMHNIG